MSARTYAQNRTCIFNGLLYGFFFFLFADNESCEYLTVLNTDTNAGDERDTRYLNSFVIHSRLRNVNMHLDDILNVGN